LDTLSSIKRLFIQIDPRFEFEYEGLQITAGFNTSIFINGKDSAVPYFNPVIKVNYPLIPGLANIYAGIDGRYQKQSLRNIINSNPFTSQYELTNMYENLKSYLGINAKMGASADAMFEIAYSDVSKMPLFVTRKDSNFAVNSFSILYTQVSLLKFSAAFNYSFSEKVRIGVLGNFYNYEISEQAYPWQLPNVDAKMNMRFNIKNKLYPHIDIMAFGAQKQKTMDINTKINTNNNIEAFYDISMGLDYRFKNKLSAFVQANNLLNNRYQRWYNYPVYGFNIIGGITMIF
jgi:RNAse (barnase) inhibitor barstar